ncbi:MAG: hypothetical protein H6868_06110 [Rhodospirillales bacterium]|nr:hypothetical protein [Rhodospirillales bacterium]
MEKSGFEKRPMRRLFHDQATGGSIVPGILAIAFAFGGTLAWQISQQHESNQSVTAAHEAADVHDEPSKQPPPLEKLALNQP